MENLKQIFAGLIAIWCYSCLFLIVLPGNTTDGYGLHAEATIYICDQYSTEVTYDHAFSMVHAWDGIRMGGQWANAHCNHQRTFHAAPYPT